MTRRRHSILQAALCLAIGMSVPEAAISADFSDPLDVPALLSPELSLKARIFSLTDNHGVLFAVGAQGTILLSGDRGGHWEQVPAPVSSDLTAIAFSTPSDGFIVGHDSVMLRSRDGGRSWTREFDIRTVLPAIIDYYRGLQRVAGEAQIAESIVEWISELEMRISNGAPLPFFDIWFSDSMHGYAVGAFNLLLVTEDGGLHWLPWMERADNPRGAHLYAVRGTHGPDGDVYIVGELGLMMRLDRKARRFVSVPTPYGGTYFALGIDDETLVIGGLRGRSFVSGDRGANWQEIETGSSASIVGAARMTSGRFSLLAQNGSVLIVDRPEAKHTLAVRALSAPSYALLPIADDSVLVGFEQGSRRINLPAWPR